MSREEHEHAMPDEELLQKLSDEYQEALLADDKMRIENNIPLDSGRGLAAITMRTQWNGRTLTPRRP